MNANADVLSRCYDDANQSQPIAVTTLDVDTTDRKQTQLAYQ